MPINYELQKIGLSDKEAKVYLAILEIAPASVQQIARKSGVNRATTYVILESLIKKGLCSTYNKNKKTLYLAENPNILERLFIVQKKEIEEREKNLKNVLPQLSAIFNRLENKPVVRFFEGKEGLLSCVTEFLSSYDANADEEVRMIYSKDKLDDLFVDEEREKYRSLRLNKKIRSKVLYTYSKGELKDSADGSRVKIIDKKFPVTCDIGIYGDSVRISSLGKSLSAVLIKDREIANTLKTLFDLAWEAAKSKK